MTREGRDDQNTNNKFKNKKYLSEHELVVVHFGKLQNT